jgi:glycosyltransferase involved in cell wall biosynthesis
VFPSTKGAAVHIGHAATTLFDHLGGGLLYALGGEDLPTYQSEPHPSGGTVEIVRFSEPIPDLPDRIEAFGGRLAPLVAAHAASLRLVQARDPWSLLPVLALAERRFPVVFEVNGLPSVELAETHRGVPDETLRSIARLEDRCIGGADLLLAPSGVLADHLVRRGADADRVHVIPNGADVPARPPPRPAEAPDGRYLVYVGALQPWQGMGTLLRALARLVDIDDLTLVVCSAWKPARTRELRRLTRRLGIDDRVVWHHRVRHRDVAGWLAHAELSVAPLAPTARNLTQGCCPLKIIESMAVGTPVVASDLPAVRELCVDGTHGRLVAPERPAELARAIRVLLEYPDLLAEMGAAGRDHVAGGLTWAHARTRTTDAYASVLG